MKKKLKIVRQKPKPKGYNTGGPVFNSKGQLLDEFGNVVEEELSSGVTTAGKAAATTPTPAGGGGMSPGLTAGIKAGAPVAAGMINNMIDNSSMKEGTGKAALKGAVSGAAAGTMIAPGVGTLIGAGAGALFSAVGNEMAERKQKKEEEKAKKRELLEANQALGSARLASTTQYTLKDSELNNITAEKMLGYKKGGKVKKMAEGGPITGPEASQPFLRTEALKQMSKTKSQLAADRGKQLVRNPANYNAMVDAPLGVPEPGIVNTPIVEDLMGGAAGAVFKTVGKTVGKAMLKGTAGSVVAGAEPAIAVDAGEALMRMPRFINSGTGKHIAVHTGQHQAHPEYGKPKMAKGGKVVGPGGPTDDKVNAKIASNSFVVPAENAPVADKIRSMVFGKNPQQKVSKMQKGGVPVKLSDGETVLSPNEVSTLTSMGMDVNKLAPEADHKLMLSKGGNVRKKEEPITLMPASKKTAAEALVYENMLAKAETDLAREAVKEPTTTVAAPPVRKPVTMARVSEALGGPAGMASAAQIMVGLVNNAGNSRPIDTVSPLMKSRYAEYLTQQSNMNKMAEYGFGTKKKNSLMEDIEANRITAGNQIFTTTGGNGTAVSAMRSMAADENSARLEVEAKDQELKDAKTMAAANYATRGDSIAGILSGMRRQVFEDKLMDFNQNQEANSELIQAGISNYIGNQIYQDTQKRADKRAKKYTGFTIDVEGLMKAYDAQSGVTKK